MSTEPPRPNLAAFLIVVALVIGLAAIVYAVTRSGQAFGLIVGAVLGWCLAYVLTPRKRG